MYEYGDAGLLGDPGEPICAGDQLGDKPDPSDIPDGEKLGPGVMPLDGPIGEASGCEGVCCVHGVRPGLRVDGVALAPKNIPGAPNGPGPSVL